MGYFALIGADDLVINKISVSNEVLGEPTLSFPDTEAAGRAFIANTLHLEGEWRQTSYSGSFRKRFAGVGDRYDRATDEFVPAGWELVNGEWQDPNPPGEAIPS